MGKVFEDEFMDLQAGLIGLCMEVSKGKVDKIYAYCSIERYALMFNAFFEVDGEVKRLSRLDGMTDDLAFRFLKVGTKDLLKLEALGKTYNRPVPTEMRLYYDVPTRKFHAEYKYAPVCNAEKGIIAEVIFDNWYDEVQVQKELGN